MFLILVVGFYGFVWDCFCLVWWVGGGVYMGWLGLDTY